MKSSAASASFANRSLGWPTCRTGVAPVSNSWFSASDPKFFGPQICHRIVAENLEDGDRRDACPTGLAFASGTS